MADIVLKITPTTITDLTVKMPDGGAYVTYTLAAAVDMTDWLELEMPCDTNGKVFIESTGYVSQTVTFQSANNPYTIDLIEATNDVANLSDGADSYSIKDKQARFEIDMLKNTKQEKLLEGTGISIGTNGVGQQEIATNPDGTTITTNASDELETIGVIDNNGNAIKTWTGTLAQYNAIATKDPNTLYNITDDMSVPQTILETLYPVGSLYIGKMSTCPLASLIPNSTWTLVASDKVLQGSGTHTAGTSVNAGLPNITGTLERVVTCTSGGSGTAVSKGSGAFSGTPSVAVNKTAPGSGNWWNDTRDLSFKASNSNSIYGKSTTVQPPAYVVNIWERTA